MLSALFVIYGVVHIGLLAWVVRLYRQTRSPAVLMVIVPMLALWYDCLVVGFGRFLGPGDLLQALSYPRFWAHWAIGSFWIIAAGSIGRLAGLRLLQRRWVMGALCVLTVLMIGIEIPHFFHLTLHPVCFADTVRYSEVVASNALCFPDQVPVSGGSPPIPPITTTAVILAVGIALWVRRGWPWMALGAIAMLMAAAVPASKYGPAPSNAGEIVLAWAMVASAARFLRATGPERTSDAAALRQAA